MDNVELVRNWVGDRKEISMQEFSDFVRRNATFLSKKADIIDGVVIIVEILNSPLHFRYNPQAGKFYMEILEQDPKYKKVEKEKPDIQKYSSPNLDNKEREIVNPDFMDEEEVPVHNDD
jgi:hypothetical protein